MAEIGGGALYDIGCYPITVARFVFGGEPQRVLALIDRDPDFNTDRTTSGIADFDITLCQGLFAPRGTPKRSSTG